MHSLGYVGNTNEEAINDFYPGYAETFTKIGKERGWPSVTKAHFNALAGPLGALIVGGPDEVAEKIERHSKALGGITRLSLQMDSANLSHEKLMNAIELLGNKVKPLLK